MSDVVSGSEVDELRGVIPKECLGCLEAESIAPRLAAFVIGAGFDIKKAAEHFGDELSFCTEGLETKPGVTCSDTKKICNHPEGHPDPIYNNVIAQIENERLGGMP